MTRLPVRPSRQSRYSAELTTAVRVPGQISSAMVPRDMTSHFGSSQLRRSLISLTGDASDKSFEGQKILNKISDEPTIFDVL